MLPSWLRLGNPYIFFPGGFLVFNFLVKTFPEPPAIQEAQARRWAQAKQAREDEFERVITERIEKYERENPGVFDQAPKWDSSNEDEWRESRG